MTRVICCLVLLMPAAGAGEDELVLDLVRRVACLGPTLVPDDYDLGPLLESSGQDERARRLLDSGLVSDDEFAALHRERAIWVLCALLDHGNVQVRARAAEELAAIGDVRTAPLLWLHGRCHYVAYPEGSPGARLRAALASAQQAIGMEPLPNGFDFLVRRWLTPAAVPPAMADAQALQRRVDAGEKITWEEVLAFLPPGARPIAGKDHWRWYRIDKDWIVSCHLLYGLRSVHVEPCLPEATTWGPEPEVGLPTRPEPAEFEQIALLVRELDNPEYRNRVEPKLPWAISGPRLPRRAAAWDLAAHGAGIAHVLIPQLGRLDQEGEYAGNYVLRQVVRPGVDYATVILGDGRSRTRLDSTAWSAWLDLARAGVPRGGLALYLRGARRLGNGDVELDYTIGWFGNWTTGLPFLEDRPVVTVLAEDADGGRRVLEARERYEMWQESVWLDPQQLLLGRFLVPEGKGIVRARVRLTLPPAPAALRGVWSGTIESNAVDVGE